MVLARVLLVGLPYLCAAIGFGSWGILTLVNALLGKKEGRDNCATVSWALISHYLCALLFTHDLQLRFPTARFVNMKIHLTVLDIAKDISEGLARNVLSAEFNQQTVEAATQIEEDGALTPVYLE